MTGSNLIEWNEVAKLPKAGSTTNRPYFVIDYLQALMPYTEIILEKPTVFCMQIFILAIYIFFAMIRSFQIFWLVPEISV